MEHWYAIYCKPRQDARAHLHLRNQDYTVFRPLARVRHRTNAGFQHRVESLFPRYLFIRLDDNDQSWAPIRSTRGVTGLVRMGTGTPPTAVPDALVGDLQSRMSEHGWIDLEAANAYLRNEKVTVVEGAFAGCDAIFQCRTAAERVVVLLTLLGATRRVELPETAITKAGL